MKEDWTLSPAVGAGLHPSLRELLEEAIANRLSNDGQSATMLIPAKSGITPATKLPSRKPKPQSST